MWYKQVQTYWCVLTWYIKQRIVLPGYAKLKNYGWDYLQTCVVYCWRLWAEYLQIYLMMLLGIRDLKWKLWAEISLRSDENGIKKIRFEVQDQGSRILVMSTLDLDIDTWSWCWKLSCRNWCKSSKIKAWLSTRSMSNLVLVLKLDIDPWNEFFWSHFHHF